MRCGVPLGRLTFLRYSASASLAGVSGCSIMRWPSQLKRRLCIVVLNSSVLLLVDSSMYAEDFPEMSPLESADCIFQFFGEGPQFAGVEENTCNICTESSDFDCVADFSVVKNFIQCFESIYCKNVSAVDVLFRV